MYDRCSATVPKSQPKPKDQRTQDGEGACVAKKACVAAGGGGVDNGSPDDMILLSGGQNDSLRERLLASLLAFVACSFGNLWSCFSLSFSPQLTIYPSTL